MPTAAPNSPAEVVGGSLGLKACNSSGRWVRMPVRPRAGPRPVAPCDEGKDPVTDTPATTSPVRPTPVIGNLGFLAVLQDPGGVLGGYLVTNTWGRPLEFRLTTAVQPTRVQQVLYGPTLTDYMHADLIGKALIEKTSILPGLIVTDTASVLGLRSRIDVPVVGVIPAGEVTSDLIVFNHERSPLPLVIPAKFAEDREVIEARLGQIDPAVDLTEPFTRVREAVAEARKMGVTNRAA
jgi:hypothetical protein